MAQKKNSLRIIGGAWRSRRIQFVDNPEIRPTPDRVRETLFNWLSNTITCANCLDLFAGSGALGLEAASRGASRVVMVDRDRATVEMLLKQQQVLQAQQIEIIQSDALSYLQQLKQQFDIVFLDPPFKSNLLEPLVTCLLESQICVAGSLIYAETFIKNNTLLDYKELYCLREKQAGQVRYALFEVVK